LFVNKYRVERVKELLINKENDHLSILGIAFESGFSSKTAFNTTFKKIHTTKHLQNTKNHVLLYKYKPILFLTTLFTTYCSLRKIGSLT
jgi:AraC-like DNA-binding protein